MTVTECEVPAKSALSRAVVQAAYFCDSYRVPLVRTDMGIVDVFFAVFGHSPLYVKLRLIARNGVAKLCGLDVASVAEIMKPKVQETYTVGDRIGPWPIFSITENEIVAGRNNRHLDFRLSVLKQTDGVPAVELVRSTEFWMG